VKLGTLDLNLVAVKNLLKREALFDPQNVQQAMKSFEVLFSHEGRIKDIGEIVNVAIDMAAMHDAGIGRREVTKVHLSGQTLNIQTRILDTSPFTGETIFTPLKIPFHSDS
jgi:ligand-binding sensor domain-containing protein